MKQAGDAFAYVWGKNRHLCWGIIDHIDDRGRWHMCWAKAVWCEKKWKKYREPKPLPGMVVDGDVDHILADFIASRLTESVEYW